MAIARTALTDDDIRSLVRGPSDDERAAAAHKLCRRIDERLTDSERAAAADVMRMLAMDAAELVRRALAVTLRNSPFLPRDVALTLAGDVDTVAAPVLNFSPAFTDEDLAEIVRSCGEAKQIAVANRAELSEAVTTALVDHAPEQAVQAAVANDNAAFSEHSLGRAVERFGDCPDLTAAMAYRKVLPLSVSERLVDLVTESVRRHLMDRHRLSPETALRIALGARERATLDLVDQAAMTTDLKGFVAHLRMSERLTPSLVLRALAHGDMAFFEWAVAELAGVSHHRTWMMVHDAGPLGLRAIYERTGLPQRLFPAFRSGVDTYHALQLEGTAKDVARFQELMLQRFLTLPQPASREDSDDMLERMDRLVRERRSQAA